MCIKNKNPVQNIFNYYEYVIQFYVYDLTFNVLIIFVYKTVLTHSYIYK